MFGVRLHLIGLAVREIVSIFDLLGIDRSHGAIWNWMHTLSEDQSDLPTAQPPRVAVDGEQTEINSERKWLYAAINTGERPNTSASAERATASEVVHRTRATVGSESSGLFHLCFCAEWFPQRTE
jgi:transposase-like protein